MNRNTILMTICFTIGSVWFSQGIAAEYFASSSKVQNIALEATIGIYMNETDRKVFDDANKVYDETNLFGSVTKWSGLITLFSGFFFAYKAVKHDSP